MKILDRYVLRSFLMNYLISFMVLIGMYVVLDMVFAFDELWELRGDAHMSSLELIARIAEHYFYQSFLIFIHLSGVIPVAAAGFTFIRMSRFNELSAMLSAGVPLLRIAAPVIFAAVILQGLLAVDQELIIPYLAPKITRKHDELQQQSTTRSFPIQAMQDGHNGLLFAGRYTPPLGDKTPALMHTVDVIEYDEAFQPSSRIVADAATWDAKHEQWKLVNGRRIAGTGPGRRVTPDEMIDSYKSDVTPDEINLYRSGEMVTLLSTERINQLLERRQLYGAQNLLRVKHFRISQLLMNVVMLLLAIPCVLMREPGKLKQSIMKCLLFVGISFAGYFVAFQLAGSRPIGSLTFDQWAAMMAFLPIVLFGGVAALLLDRLANRDT